MKPVHPGQSRGLLKAIESPTATSDHGAGPEANGELDADADVATEAGGEAGTALVVAAGDGPAPDAHPATKSPTVATTAHVRAKRRSCRGAPDDV